MELIILFDEMLENLFIGCEIIIIVMCANYHHEKHGRMPDEASVSDENVNAQLLSSFKIPAHIFTT